MVVTICMSYLTTGDPGKEWGTNKLPPMGRIQERSKREKRRQSICPVNLLESSSLESILAEWHLHHKEGHESEWWARHSLETNPITIKPETKSRGRAVLLGSLTFLLSFPINALPARVSLDNSFFSLRQESTQALGAEPFSFTSAHTQLLS